jgi:hypothetical protein
VPIRPENRSRYPADWDQISRFGQRVNAACGALADALEPDVPDDTAQLDLFAEAGHVG